MERAVSPNRPQVGIRVELPAYATDLNGLLLEVNTSGRDVLRSILPVLELESVEDLQDVDPEDGLNDNQDPGHVLPGLEPDAENGDEGAANDHIQRNEQEDLRALRSILGHRISGNAITGRHCWQVLKKLRGIMRKGDSQRIPKGQDYARILERMARVMTIPDEQDYNSVSLLGVHPLGSYECVFKLLNEMTPDFSCPLDHGECLDRLCDDLTVTSSVMRDAEGIFVTKDREQYARRLRSLVAQIV